MIDLLRWSLIAGRLPGRTDNEIKNYWNSHLSKKMNQQSEKESDILRRKGCKRKVDTELREEETSQECENSSNLEYDVDNLFDFSNEGPDLEWMSKFL